MAKKKRQERGQRATEEVWPELPPGVKLLRTLKGHQDTVLSVAFDPQGETLASGSSDHTVRLWEAQSGKLLRTLEGHTGRVSIVAFSPDGRLLASKSVDHTIWLWSCKTWETVAVIPELTHTDWWIPALAFHPTLPLLAAAGSEADTPNDERCRLIHLWELDLEVLLSQRAGAAARAVHHTTGKIVLVGDHSVGKSALGYRMIHGEFKEQASTHGSSSGCFPTWASAARTGPTARRSSGTWRASPTTGWSTRSLWTTPISRWCCSMPRTSTTRCTAWASGSSNSRRGKVVAPSSSWPLRRIAGALR